MNFTLHLPNSFYFFKNSDKCVFFGGVVLRPISGLFVLVLDGLYLAFRGIALCRRTKKTVRLIQAQEARGHMKFTVCLN